MSAGKTILLIEDNPADQRFIELLIDEAVGSFFHLEKSDKLSTGIDILEKMRIDLVLLDLSLPDSQGLDTLDNLHKRKNNVAIIVLTGNQDEEIGVRAIHRGAQDYLVKGEIDSKLLSRSIRYAIERKRHERALREQAFLDHLTNLYTTRYLANRLEVEFKSTRRYGHPFSIAAFSIRPLGKMRKLCCNATYEDTVLKVGRVFHEELRAEDVSGIYEDETFLALFPHASKTAVVKALRRIQARVEAIDVKRQEGDPSMSLSLAFGVCEQAADHQVPEQLLHDALKALAEEEKILHN